MQFFVNSSTPEEELVNIHIIVMDSVTLNISAIVYKYIYGAINIDDPKVEGLYVLQFTSMAYTLQDSIYVKFDTIPEGKLVCYSKYMRPAQDNLRWYLETEVPSI